MDMAQLERARTQERTYERRAARTRRSKWLGRLLFSLLGMGLMMALRFNPAAIEDIVALAHGTGQNDATPRIIAKPSDVLVRKMPSDAIPVRRGGTLPGNGTRVSAQDNAQTQAEDVGRKLRTLNPGG